MIHKLSDLKTRLIAEINGHSDYLRSIALQIHSNPELGFEEYKATKILTEYLRDSGFNIESGIYGLPTAFRATYGEGRPRLAFLGEYDALPDIGHACGHNLIAASSAGASVACRRVVDLYGGQIQYIGTPAEELFGGKIIMCQKGCFDDLDAVMMVHPESGKSVAMAKALACATLNVEYFGQEAHAAAEPHAGVNALDAIVIAYNALSALRQHIRPDARVHGIITDGGVAANIVPGHSAGVFLVRATELDYLEELKNKVLGCFRAGEQATSAKLDYSWDSIVYQPLKNNNTLAKLFVDNFESLGQEIDLTDSTSTFGSTDMGNVSQILPGLHAFVSIAPAQIAGHTREFAQAAQSELGINAMTDAAKALAMTVADLFSQPELLVKMKDEFKTRQVNI